MNFNCNPSYHNNITCEPQKVLPTVGGLPSRDDEFPQVLLKIPTFQTWHCSKLLRASSSRPLSSFTIEKNTNITLYNIMHTRLKSILWFMFADYMSGPVEYLQINICFYQHKWHRNISTSSFKRENNGTRLQYQPLISFEIICVLLFCRFFVKCKGVLADFVPCIWNMEKSILNRILGL